jgi:hypothetical protein
MGPEYDSEQLADVSAHEYIANAPQDENEEHRRIRQVKNAKCVQRKRNMENRARGLMYQRDLNNTFAVVADQEYRTPIGAIAEVVLLAQQLPPNPQIERLHYLSQRALVQLDGQHPVSSTRNLPSWSEHHGETALISRTPGGGPGNQRNEGCQRNEGHPSVRGNDEQEVQQSTHQPRNQRGARSQGQAPLKASLHNAPTIDLRQKINDATICGVLSKLGEGTVLASATMMTIVTASPPSPPTSPTNPIQTSSKQLESPSTTVSRTRASGFDANLLILKF